MAKPKIENIHVEHVDGIKFAIGWTIDGFRFHIWAERGLSAASLQLQGSVFKNPPAGVKHRQPGYFDTRQIDPEAKTQAAILAEVLAVVERDELVRKARRANAEKIQRARRKTELEQALYQVDQEALEAWKAGKFSVVDVHPGNVLLNRRRGIEMQLRRLADEMVSSVSSASMNETAVA
jgi:hypothetical protein